MSSNEDWREWLREWGVPASTMSKEPVGVQAVPVPAPQPKNPFFSSEPAALPRASQLTAAGAVKPPRQPKSPRPPKQPKQPIDPEKKKLFLKMGIAAAVVMPLILVVVLIAVLVPSSTEEEPEETTPTTTVAIKKWCEPRTGSPYVSDSGGSTSTPQGVLAEMWRQYLGLRSASGYVSLTNGLWIDEASVARQIAQQVPEKEVEWCTTITPLEENWWKVQVHWRTLDKSVEKLWISDYSTAEVPGQGYVITGTRRNADLEREIKEKTAKEAQEKAKRQQQANNRAEG